MRALSKACGDAAAEAGETAAVICERLAASGHLSQAFFTKSMWLCTGDGESDSDIKAHGSDSGRNDLESSARFWHMREARSPMLLRSMTPASDAAELTA